MVRRTRSTGGAAAESASEGSRESAAKRVKVDRKRRAAAAGAEEPAAVRHRHNTRHHDSQRRLAMRSLDGTDMDGEDPAPLLALATGAQVVIEDAAPPSPAAPTTPRSQQSRPRAAVRDMLGEGDSAAPSEPGSARLPPLPPRTRVVEPPPAATLPATPDTVPTPQKPKHVPTPARAGVPFKRPEAAPDAARPARTWSLSRGLVELAVIAMVTFSFAVSVFGPVRSSGPEGGVRDVASDPVLEQSMDVAARLGFKVDELETVLASLQEHQNEMALALASQQEQRAAWAGQVEERIANATAHWMAALDAARTSMAPASQLEAATAALGMELKALQAALNATEAGVEEKHAQLAAAVRALQEQIDGMASPPEAQDKVTRDDVLALIEERVAAACSAQVVPAPVETPAAPPADGTGMPDYALASAGARVLAASPSFAPVSSLLSLRMGRPARTALEPGTAPGNCWAFAGSEGYLTVGLVKPVQVTAITLEHVAANIAYDISSAPRAVRAVGLANGSEVSLGEFVFDPVAAPLQSFNVTGAGEGRGAVDAVKLDVLSNHGHPDYTCLYRLRVHGHGV